VVRLAQDAEIRFQARAGQLYHEALRLGLPDMAPDLLASSRGSVGLDQELDLVLEIPRVVVKLKLVPADAKATGWIRIRVTGSIDKPTETEIKEDKEK
jgi:hypothetical protein